jgi:hypothetical protein
MTKLCIIRQNLSDMLRNAGEDFSWYFLNPDKKLTVAGLHTSQLTVDR